MATLRKFDEYPGMVLVWRIDPDPDHIFDYLIVGSAAEAGQAAARGAEMSWDNRGSEGDPAEAGDGYAVSCFLMPKDEFEALPEP